MFINNVLNFQGGWEFLSEHKLMQLQEITNSINAIDRNILLDEKYHLYSRGATVDPFKINSIVLSRCWHDLIAYGGWKPLRVGDNAGTRGNIFLRSVKEGVSVRMLTGDRVFLPNWIFVETQRAHEIGACEVSVLLIPMKSVHGIYNQNGGPKISFEDAEIQVNDLSPLRASAPFVIIGFSEVESSIQIVDVLSEENFKRINTIDKCIEFSPEHYQAGMSILSYFGEIIRTKHPDIQAKVRIEQDGKFVRLHIETEDGTKEIIEKTLEDYTLVVSNNAPIDTLFDNKIHMMALQNKLEMANMEVRQTRELLELTKEFSRTRQLSLEDEVRHLRSYIGSQMSLVSESHQIIRGQASASNRMALGIISSSNLLIKDLLADKLIGLKVLDSLKLIDEKLARGVSGDDEVVVKSALRVITEEAPDIIDELSEALKNTAYGVSGNAVYNWLVTILNTALG